MLCNVSSGYVWFGQLKSEYVRIFQVSQFISYVTLGQVSTVYVRFCQVRSGIITLGEVKSGKVSLVHVRS
jgi:hypothetical protein